MSKRVSLRTVAVVVLSCAFDAPAASAATVYGLEFEQLPSAVGWQYLEPFSNLSESTAFEVLAGGLEMNTTLGSLGNLGLYALQGVVGADTIIVDFDMKVVASAGNYGFGVFVSSGTTGETIQFNTTSIDLYAFGSIPFDTTGFHAYSWVVQPGVGSALYIDGSTTAAITGGTFFPGVSNGLYFGDGQADGNADVILAVPEEGAISMCLVAFAAMIFHFTRLKAR